MKLRNKENVLIKSVNVKATASQKFVCVFHKASLNTVKKKEKKRD